MVIKACPMMAKRLFLIILFIPYSLLWSQNTFGEIPVKQGEWNGKTVEYLEDYIAIRLKSHVDSNSVIASLSKQGGALVKKFDKLRWGKFKVPTHTDVPSLSMAIMNWQGVEASYYRFSIMTPDYTKSIKMVLLK